MRTPDFSIARKNGWDVRLMRWANGCIGADFVWNKTNCVALAAAALDAMCGSDLFGWQKRMRLNERRAIALSRRRPALAALRAVGCHAVDPAYIQRGDILVATENGMECCHISIGLNSVSSSAARGVHLVTTESIVLNAKDLEVYRCQ
jgi:hypothetical protein